jgi:NAD(P)-dependent dehydrogenase (short-subunit alcohol dehydrogenase family)
MNLDLAGKTVIITGGGSNIGRGITLGFAKEGSNIVLADIDEPQGQKVAKLANTLGGRTTFVKTDISQNAQVEAMVKKALDEFKQIDVLVNNVGWNGGAPFMDKSIEESQKEIATNLWGPVNCIKAVLPHMIERKYGAIVSISSDAGRVGESLSSIYSACKGGIVALSKSIARELGRRHGIRLNVVSPGLTLPGDPPGHYQQGSEEVGEKSVWSYPWYSEEKIQQIIAKAYPLGKIGRPEDIANAVLFLASDRAGHITGQTLSVSGGYTMI